MQILRRIIKFMRQKFEWLFNVNPKEIFFIALLILSGREIGVLCSTVSYKYAELFYPFSQAMKSAAWVIGMLLLISTLIALASALLRPLKLLLFAHALGALAFFFTWQHGMMSAVNALIYLIGISYYSMELTSELDLRLVFSMRPLGYEHRKIFMLLSLMLSISFAWGYKLSTTHDALKIPQYFKDSAQDLMLSGLKSQVQHQPGIDREQQSIYLDQARQSIDKAWTEIEDAVQPYVRFIPISLVLPLYFLILSLLDTLWMIPYFLLWMIFSILAKLGIAQTVVETKEQKRLRL